MGTIITIFLLTLYETLLSAKPTEPPRKGWPFEKVKFNFSIQSPVNIITATAKRIKLPELEFHRLKWENVTVHVKNTGYTVELSIPFSSATIPSVSGGPLHSVYQLDHVDLHWGVEDFDGGEHELDGLRFAIEGHAIHFKKEYGSFEKSLNKDDGLAVIAFFGKTATKDNPHIGALTNLLPHIKQPNNYIDITGNTTLKWFANLGEPSHYYTYPGSLTTPPYSENVVWIVYPKPLYISEKQVAAFRELLSKNMTQIKKNRREIQPFNERPLIYAL